MTRAPEPMFRAARDFLLDLEARGRRLKVHPMHVAEAVYVLAGEVYGLIPEEAARELGALLTARVFEPLDEAALARALEAYPGTGLGFPDVFFLARVKECGGRVVSFDRGMQNAGIMVLSPAHPDPDRQPPLIGRMAGRGWPDDDQQAG